MSVCEVLHASQAEVTQPHPCASWPIPVPSVGGHLRRCRGVAQDRLARNKNDFWPCFGFGGSLYVHSSISCECEVAHTSLAISPSKGSRGLWCQEADMAMIVLQLGSWWSLRWR